MSIAPPSDIIMDVAQAADPAQRQAAINKLAQAAVNGGGVSFETALGDASGASLVGVGRDKSLAMSPLQGRSGAQITAAHTSPYQKFEAMVLQNFVENILPKDSDLFGDAASADMTRSMLAEKIADQLARSGRIGIAKSIEKFETAKVAQAQDAASAAGGVAAAHGPGTPASVPPLPAMPNLSLPALPLPTTIKTPKV